MKSKKNDNFLQELYSVIEKRAKGKDDKSYTRSLIKEGKDKIAEKLAEESTHIEINLLNKPIGKQDQYAAAIGGINLFTFNDNDTVSIKPIHLNSISMQRMFDSIISFDSK